MTFPPLSSRCGNTVKKAISSRAAAASRYNSRPDPTPDGANRAVFRMSAIKQEAARRRTFAIISHPDAGKTTLTEKLLLKGGAIQLAGQVRAKGNARRTRSDWMKIEQERGISVATRPGAQVTSPCDGWVVYAGPFRSYGQLLIINAGGGYHVLLAGMERIDVQLGQFILAGEPVAMMASQKLASAGAVPLGASQQALYVEFRKEGTSIDPTPWWAASSDEKVGG